MPSILKQKLLKELTTGSDTLSPEVMLMAELGSTVHTLHCTLLTFTSVTPRAQILVCMFPIAVTHSKTRGKALSIFIFQPDHQHNVL